MESMVTQIEKVSKLSYMLNCIPTKFRVEKYKYSILRVIPYKTSYKDNDFEKIINTLSKYNKSFAEKLEYRKNTKELIYHPNQPICHEVLFTKDKISYFYAIPEIYKNIFVNKIRFLLNECEIIEEQNDHFTGFLDSYLQRYKYKNNWLFSLNTSKDVNINDNLLVLNKDLVNDTDKILLQYMIEPIHDYNWKPIWESNFKKFSLTGDLKNGGVLNTLDSITNFALNNIDMIINAIMMSAFGEEPIQDKEEKINFTKELSNETKHKTVYDGFKTNVNLYIKSNNNTVVQNIIRNTNTIMQDLANDNGLVPGKLIKTKEVDRKIASKMIMNTMECKQFIKTISEDKMKEYEHLVDKINIAETTLPDEMLKESGILLGEIKKGDLYKNITFGSHKDSISKPLVYIAPQEGGKSTFARNYAVSALEQGHSVFIFDTIDGRTVNTVRDYLAGNYPDEKIKVLDFGNDEYIFPLLWNEISDVYYEKLEKEDDIIKKYKIMEEFSSAISTELQGFIDTLQIDFREQRLTPRMKKILNDLTQLVFMNKGTFSMVRDCLFDTKLRHKLLNKLNLPNHIPFCKSIYSIDSEPESSMTLKGIESRLNILTENTEVQKFFSVNTDKKLDFAKWANEGCAVIINVPENKFKSAINPIVTFLVQKLWLAIMSSRYDIPEDKRIPTHLIIDEPNKFPAVMDLLQDNIIASRKWRLRFVFMIHNINIFNRMYENLKSAGTSFIIVPPTSTHNFNQISEFFEPYKIDELKEVEKLTAKSSGKFRFAICSIHYKNTNYPCIVKLPIPVDMRYKKVDRGYLNLKCAEEYGVKEDDYYKEMFGQKSIDTGMEKSVDISADFERIDDEKMLF